ncbi:MAG: GNAT family N-acetyltransferase [Clostridiales bacterium]|nr:GNAT family N-acetyltransferase [Clostridiales bacterium]
MAYSIRRAARADIPRLLELLTQVDMVHHRVRPDLFRGPATKYSAAELEHLLRDDAHAVFVCTEEDGRVLGHAFFEFRQITDSAVLAPVRTLYIDDICVDEACRGRGAGKALYRAALALARETGCHNVTLNVWAFNESALRFYESCGMKPQKIGMETVL